MNKIKTIFVAAAVIIAALSVSSCNDPKPLYNSFVTVLTEDGPGGEEAQGYPYFFVTDDSLRLYPVNHAEYPKFKPTDNSRGFAYFYEVVEDTKDATKDSYNIELYDYGNMLVKEVLYTNQIDTTGTDKISPLSIWCSGGVHGAKRMINFKIQVLSQNLPIPHKVHLVRDLSSEEPIIDEEGYYCLEFRHNAGKNAGGGYSLVDYAAFPIEEEMTADNVVGLKITFDTLNEGKKEYKIQL